MGMVRRIVLFLSLVVTGIAVPVAQGALYTYPGGKGQFLFAAAPGPTNIYTSNPDGSYAGRLIRNGFHPTWSPDGSSVVFSRRTDESGDDIDLFSVKSDGSERKRLTSMGGYEDQASFAPDGSRIAFLRNPDPRLGLGSELFLMNADGSDPAPAGLELDPDLYRSIRDIAWSPDARSIAYVVLLQEGAPGGEEKTELWSFDLASGATTLLSAATYRQLHPSFAPDGSRVAYAFGREVHVVGNDGGESVIYRSPDTSGPIAGVAWAPDGSSIAVVETYDPQSDVADVRLVDPVTGQATLIVQRQGIIWLEWQPCQTSCILDTPRVVDIGIRSIGSTLSRVVVSLSMRPIVKGAEVVVRLQRRRLNRFRTVQHKTLLLDRDGQGQLRFELPKPGTCRFLVTYGGDGEHRSTTTTPQRSEPGTKRRFSCTEPS